MGEHEKHAHRACFSCLKEEEGGPVSSVAAAPLIASYKPEAGHVVDCCGCGCSWEKAG